VQNVNWATTVFGTFRSSLHNYRSVRFDTKDIRSLEDVGELLAVLGWQSERIERVCEKVSGATEESKKLMVSGFG
jgi:hypothetical protein